MNGKSNTAPIFHYFPKSKKETPNCASEFYKKNLPQPTKESKDEEIVDKNLVLENQELKLQLKEAHTKIEQLIKENKKYQNDLVSLKKLYNATCRSYVQKDFKIKLLEKHVSNGNGTSCDKKIMYEKHKDSFDEQTMIKLRSVNGTKRSDSTFVLIIMRKLYEHSSILHTKSACGTYKDKTEISPDKRAIIESLLIERLSIEAINEEDANLRYIRLNDLINNAINNMCRSTVRLFIYTEYIFNEMLTVFLYEENAFKIDRPALSCCQNSIR